MMRRHLNEEKNIHKERWILKKSTRFADHERGGLLKLSKRKILRKFEKKSDNERTHRTFRCLSYGWSPHTYSPEAKSLEK